MNLTQKAKYRVALGGTALLLLFNTVFLYFAQRYDTEFRADPLFDSYLRMRSFLLRPASVCLLGLGLVVWSFLIYWRSRIKPPSESQKIAYFCIILATVGGYILTAWFKL